MSAKDAGINGPLGKKRPESRKSAQNAKALIGTPRKKSKKQNEARFLNKIYYTSIWG